MPVPSTIEDLSTAESSNFPAGTETPKSADNYLRAHAAFIAQLRDSMDDLEVEVQPIARGGTGATTAAGARTALGAATTGDAIFQASTPAAARLAAGVPNSGPLSGLRNLVINGRGAINQRGYVSGAATSGANQYTLDRWRVVVSGQSLSWTASGNGKLMTAPAGGVEQVIEGASVSGGTYTVNWTGTATCTINSTTYAKGATVTLEADTNATLRFSSGTFDEVQLEPGEVATAFEAVPVGMNLYLCQRYFEKRNFFATGYNSGGSFIDIDVPFTVVKRVDPTFVYGGLSYGNASGATTVAIGPERFVLRFTVTTTGGATINTSWTADAEF